MRFYFTIFLVFMTSLALQGQEAMNLLRSPSISPDGQMIAFSYQGDIWTSSIDGKNLKRLTIHEAYESQAVWSPDGQEIAFTSNRMGNNDIFIMSREGSLPRRMTHHSIGDMAYDWKGESIYFTTRRAFQQLERDLEIYSVSTEGGTPARFLDAVGDMPALSPNGRYLAFVRGVCRTAREQYRGPANNDIWIFDTKTQEYTQVSNHEMNDYYPRWADDNTLYYISARTGRYNIVQQKISEGGKVSGSPSPITNFTEDGVRHFDIAGNTLVFEQKTDIYRMQIGQSPQKIDINIQSDYRFDPQERMTFRNGINGYSVSPNGKYIAMEIRGEIFVKENDKEKRRSVNLSNHPYRDQDPTWLNDSTLIFVSDREGQQDLYLVRSADANKSDIFKSLKYEVKALSNTPEEEHSPAISPDAKKIAYAIGRGKLVTANIDQNGKMSGSKTLHDSWNVPSDMAWSPDSRWLAYSVSSLNFNQEVYIHRADNSQPPVNVSMHPKGDSNPFWSPDGSKLGFVSNRNDGGDRDVWFVWLKSEDFEKTQRDREEGYYFEEEESDKSAQSKAKAGPIEIDFDKIYDRQMQVTSLPGNESAPIISKDGETFYFTSNTGLDRGSDLFEIKWDGSKIKQLTKGGASPRNLFYHSEKDLVFYLSRGVLSYLKSGKSTRLPHQAQMIIDHQQEREQIFEEAWRALNAGFYDPDFHGQNWEALKAKYKPWALAASTTQDFRYMVNTMLGQLNASHMGLYGSDPEKTQNESTGRLGIEVEPTSGGVLVSHVIPNTPASKEKSLIREGEIITAVNGFKITPNVNFHSLFVEESDNQVLLSIKDKQGKEREVVIRPTRSINNDLYEEWVSQRQKLTEKYSNGRLGYIHIRGMNMPSFERFQRELTASGLGKEGIVIDVRFNGGGWTTDYLMTVLSVRQHAYTIPRGAAKNLASENKKFQDYYPYSERLPLTSWTKPSVALCNESSYSNAEIFSHAYKNLDIGTLVGKPTFGAVISTGGARLMDGSLVRMPFRAWYVKATGENMENGPAVPDVLVDNAPDSKMKGEDPQLKKSVEVLLKEIGELSGKK